MALAQQPGCPVLSVEANELKLLYGYKQTVFLQTPYFPSPHTILDGFATSIPLKKL